MYAQVVGMYHQMLNGQPLKTTLLPMVIITMAQLLEIILPNRWLTKQTGFYQPILDQLVIRITPPIETKVASPHFLGDTAVPKALFSTLASAMTGGVLPIAVQTMPGLETCITVTAMCSEATMLRAQAFRSVV